MLSSDKYPKQYDLCECGQSKTIKSNYCNKCSNSKRIKFHTLKDTTHSVVHGQSARFNIIRGRARNQHKHIKACQFCGYDKHVEVCHIKPIHSFPEDTLVSIINDPSNILILCPNCHWEHDRQYRKPKQEKVKKQRKRKVEWPTKEVLEKLLWEKPTTQISKQYGVSDKAVEKWTKKYNLTKPPRGYWAKKKVGAEGNAPSSIS
jgi:hypothetical protein